MGRQHCEAAVGISSMGEIDREMTPILAELLTLTPGYLEDHPEGHPVAKQLFIWLVDPQRTGEEFSYTTRYLLNNVLEIMYLHFQDYLYNPNSYSRKYCKYPDKIALEALAARCLVLEGQWEHVAWLIVAESRFFCNYTNGNASELLSAWIIQMIGNPDCCPNVFLRIRLMILLNLMVDPSDNNWTQALESVMSPCSFLDETFPDIYVAIVTKTLRKFALNGNLLMLDEKLSKDLFNIKSLRLSAFVCDVTYNSAIKENAYSHPVAFRCLYALLKTISGFTKVALGQDDADGMVDSMDITTVLLQLITSYFMKSCQTPQLVQLTLSCLRDVRQLVINAKLIWSLEDINLAIDELI